MNTSTTASRRQRLPARLLALWVVGDALVVLMFSAIGRASHQLSAGHPLAAALLTAAPFALAWAIVAPLMAYIADAAGALATLKGWLLHTAITALVAGPLGVALRALFFERPILSSFMLVATLSLLVMMGVWRAIYWWLYRRLA